MTKFSTATCRDLTDDFKAGRATARRHVEASLARIAAYDTRVNAFTDVLADRALARADMLDAARSRGEALGPLAGVPFAVKNLFDAEGVPTRAGSRINVDKGLSRADATLIRKLEAAGAILIGCLNMGEYAYDFTGENAHYGPSHNPHDLARMTGGSSGGSGACVAAGMVPLALGSDTNGSIRVPSSLCGLFGLKPTFGRLSRAGTFPFVASLDHLGPMTRSVADLAVTYDCMQGRDESDPAQTPRESEPVSGLVDAGVAGLRIARAAGFFEEAADPPGRMAVERVCATLGATARVDYPEPLRARAAAFLITMAEGAALHLDTIRTRAAEYDPDVRERLMAGALLPAAWIQKAQKFRRWHAAAAARMFEDVDILIAPATPCQAPLIGQKTFMFAGAEVPVRANLGVFTQPFSFIGLPVVSAPVWLEGETMPIGVQLIAPPWREDLALRAARALEIAGLARAPVAQL
ncbi:MAG: AtzE family amidohydrolase [Beijerinckiaceae bacterium]|nr:AtzE family amidohydrolase [Beijerinckiaceae bacterium]